MRQHMDLVEQRLLALQSFQDLLEGCVCVCVCVCVHAHMCVCVVESIFGSLSVCVGVIISIQIL